MALDHGTRNLGIAFCDEMEIIASPFAVWPNQGPASISRLAALAREEGVQGLLVGLPRHKDGAESATAPLARAFAQALAGATGLPLRFCDEYLTSVEADRLLAQRGVKAKDRKSRLDSASAAVMLQDFMEHRHSLGKKLDQPDE
jgi:putative Holliday junction resolvase